MVLEVGLRVRGWLRLWGEQNDHNENFFDFFCEKSIS